MLKTLYGACILSIWLQYAYATWCIYVATPLHCEIAWLILLTTYSVYTCLLAILLHAVVSN